MDEKDESYINAVISDLQRMTSGNVAHIRDNCIGSLRNVIVLSKMRKEKAASSVAAAERLKMRKLIIELGVRGVLDGTERNEAIINDICKREGIEL